MKLKSNFLYYLDHLFLNSYFYYYYFYLFLIFILLILSHFYYCDPTFCDSNINYAMDNNTTYNKNTDYSSSVCSCSCNCNDIDQEEAVSNTDHNRVTPIEHLEPKNTKIFEKYQNICRRKFF